MTEWVEVFFTYDDVEAGIVKDILESGSIEVVVDSKKVTPYPVSIGGMGEIRLLVKKSEIDNAENIIKIMRNTKETDNDS